MLCTQDLSSLPDISLLRALGQSLDVLEAIMSRDWTYRDYTFGRIPTLGVEVLHRFDWSGDELNVVFSEAGAVIRGYDADALMSPFSSEPPRVWPGVLEQVPPEFMAVLSNPDFLAAFHQPPSMLLETTFCIWRTHDSSSWQRGDIEFPEPDNLEDVFFCWLEDETLPDDENDAASGAASDSDDSIYHDIPNDPDGSAYLLRLLDGNPRSYQIWAEQNYERPVSLDAIAHIYEHRPLTQSVIAALNPDCSLQELLAEIKGVGYGNAPSTATA